MKRNLTTLLMLLTIMSSYGQEVKRVKKSRRFISLKTYNEKFKGKLPNISPSDYLIRENDTLVPIPNDFKMFEGVRVAYQPMDSLFLETYKDIVYRKYHSKAHKNSDIKMRYWKDEVKIYFAKSVDKRIKNELKSFATSLNNEIDSLIISFVKKVEDSNYIIFSVENESDFQFNANLKKKTFDFYLNWNGWQQIYKCALQLYPNKYKDIDTQVLTSKMLFFKSLGYFTPSHRIPKGSYLSASPSKTRELTDLDLQFLQYHYSYGICKGTDLNDFEEQHESAKKLLKEENRFMYFVHKD